MTVGIRAVAHRQVLNSHGEWTPELTLELADGRRGRGAAPRGETPSIYERRNDAAQIPIAHIRSVLCGELFTQTSLDRVLADRQSAWGSDVIFALSTAFFACQAVVVPADYRPRLLFNVVNGGRFARTNAVNADIAEVLLVSLTDDIAATIEGYRRLDAGVRRELGGAPLRIVEGRRVHDIGGTTANDRAIELVTDLIELNRLETTFGVMVDASAGDWWDGNSYRLPVTGMVAESAALVDYWTRLVERHPIMFLEDPFAEVDVDSWREFHGARRDGCHVFADNFTSTNPAELVTKAKLTDGVIVKPDQNGTVSGAREFTEVARSAGLQVAASHRSIETDTDALIRVAVDLGIRYLKIGPYTDFSAVARTNALLRLMGTAS